jgi:ADP-ribose pyrophosphatase YjhB (NUDIX family)
MWRIGLRGAYLLLRVWWGIRRPETHGAHLAVWCGDSLLLVRNSYRRGESVPAGRIHRGEAPALAASRELREEVGVVATPEALVAAGVHVVDFEGKRDHAHFFEWRAPEGTRPRPDRREVIRAEWVDEGALTERPLLPHTRAYLQSRQRRKGTAS